MAKPKVSKEGWDARAKDLLSGRSLPEPGALIDLIHEVNPTGRGRGADEVAARYALKSRLQSLLLSTYGAEIELTTDAKEPGVVAIRHRYVRHDACHAVIAELSDDARSWVQRELDLADDAPEASRVTKKPSPGGAPLPAKARDSDPLGLEALLLAGKRAEAEYDYEEAERCYARAVRDFGGELSAALAFLELSVDTLGTDVQALALESRLPAKTVAHASVAALLAIAAARTGEEELALYHVERATDGRAAEALALLARRAVSERDDERATAHLRAAQERDPACSELLPIGEAIAKLRAELRAPDEATLAVLLAEGRDREALLHAEGILRRYPESDSARRGVRTIEERFRGDEGHRLLGVAKEALVAGEDAVALEHLHRALGCPLQSSARAEAMVLVERLTERQREKADQERVDHVGSLLATGDRTRALIAYAELPGELRPRVRGRLELALLTWIDHVPAARPGGRIRLAVEAVLALERAEALAARDPLAAAALLVGHERLLEDVPVAVAIIERARIAALEARQTKARTTLNEAKAALFEGKVGHARELFDRIDRRDLVDDGPERALELEGQIGMAEAYIRLVQRFETFRATGAFALARSVAAAIQAGVSGEESAHWMAASEAIAEHVERTFAPMIEEQDGGAELLQDLNFDHAGHEEVACIDESGQTLTLASFQRAWLFLRIYDVPTARVVRTVRAALDQPLFDSVCAVQPNSVVVLGCSGFLEFALPSFELMRRFSHDWRQPFGGDLLRHPMIAPNASMLWAAIENKGTWAKAIDIGGERRGKAIPGIRMRPYFVTGAKVPRVMTVKRWTTDDDSIMNEATFHEMGGASVGRVELRPEPCAVAVHPSGVGFIVVARTFGVGEIKAFLVELSERYVVVSSRLIANADAGFFFPAAVIPAGDDDMAFVHFRNHDGEGEILALRSAGHDGERPRPATEVYRVKVPLRTTVVHDSSARRAFAVVDGAGSIEVKRLNGEPPMLGDTGPIYTALTPYSGVLHCARGDENDDPSRELYWQLRKVTRKEWPALMADVGVKWGKNPNTLLTFAYAAVDTGWLEQAQTIIAEGHARFPNDWRYERAHFEVLAARRSFSALRDALDRAGPEGFAGNTVQHFHHLHGVAAGALGDLDAARHHLAKAKAFSYGPCSHSLQGLQTSVDALSEPVTDEDLALDRPVARQHVAILQAADERLARGDAEGALAILERPLVWDLRDCQALARVAEAHLALCPTTRGGRFRKALALAAFANSLIDNRLGQRSEMLAPGRRYEEERLIAIKDRAIEWIEVDHPGPRDPRWLDL